MSVTFKIEGLEGIDAQLERLSKAQGKAVLRRTLKKAAEPLAETARSLAPRDPEGGDLARSIAVSTKLSQRQAKLHRRMFKDERSAVEMFVGPGPDPAAWNQEFGNVNHGPQSFMRPAWAAEQGSMLEAIKVDLWAETEKAVGRAQRKAARLAARGR